MNKWKYEITDIKSITVKDENGEVLYVFDHPKFTSYEKDEDLQQNKGNNHGSH